MSRRLCDRFRFDASRMPVIADIAGQWYGKSHTQRSKVNKDPTSQVRLKPPKSQTTFRSRCYHQIYAKTIYSERSVRVHTGYECDFNQKYQFRVIRSRSFGLHLKLHSNPIVEFQLGVSPNLKSTLIMTALFEFE